MTDTTGTTVTVETEASPDETPEVVDTGDTVIVTPPPAETSNDGEIERWVEVNRKIDSLASAVEQLAASTIAVATVAEVAAETATEAQSEVTEAIANDSFTEDEIVPRQTHAWFRPLDEWRGR